MYPPLVKESVKWGMGEWGNCLFLGRQKLIWGLNGGICRNYRVLYVDGLNIHKPTSDLRWVMVDIEGNQFIMC